MNKRTGFLYTVNKTPISITGDVYLLYDNKSAFENIIHLGYEFAVPMEKMKSDVKELPIHRALTAVKKSNGIDVDYVYQDIYFAMDNEMKDLLETPFRRQKEEVVRSIGLLILELDEKKEQLKAFKSLPLHKRLWAAWKNNI